MKDEIAQTLALAAATYYRAAWLKVDTDEQARRCKQLNRYGVLSVQALASIFDVTPHRIEKILKGDVPVVRGTLNPKHISILAYALSNHDISSATLRIITAGGTSLSMVQHLTLISRATLQRRKHEVD